MRQGYFYIVSNYTRTTFYCGMTNNILRRIYEHKEGIASRFTGAYNCRYLVYYEVYPTILQAIRREKQVKNWHRDWKITLIRKRNPEMRDLSDEL